MQKAKVIFYKGDGNIVDKTIRWWTDGPFSHCEIYIPEDEKSYSSSGMDGGCRSRKHTPNDNWEEVEIDVDIELVHQFFNETVGTEYDFLGAFGFVLPFKDRSDRWFCSEWCSNILKISGDKRMWKTEPSTLSPNDFYKLIKENDD